MKKIIVLFLATILVFTGSNETVKAQGFSDVTNTHPFYEHMVYSFDEGIIHGYSKNRFVPDKNVTRGEAIIMIARTLGLNMQKRKTAFSDVGSSTAASGAIQSAYEKGIITKSKDGKFYPSEPVKRSDMAIFLASAFSMVDEEVVPFSDVAVSSNAYSAIRKVIAAGVTQGHTDGTFKPNKLVTRSDFAGFLARATSEKFRLPVNTCGYNPASHVNPDRQTMNCLITKAARQSEFPIPPEIVKAVATVESSWKQFDGKGEPNISSDGGIGLMQITSTAGYDVERLKFDLQYNIETGIEFLVKNFNNSNLPKVGDHNPKNLESWYFAVMAYNGIKAVNSPFYQATGDQNPNAYQERVYQELSKNGLLSTNIQSIAMTKSDFNYGADTNHTIDFMKKKFELSKQGTASKELLKAGEVITYTGSGIRLQPSTQNNKPIPTTTGVKMTILGSPISDEHSSASNQYVWYPVQTVQNGKAVSGFIASPYIFHR